MLASQATSAKQQLAYNDNTIGSHQRHCKTSTPSSPLIRHFPTTHNNLTQIAQQIFSDDTGAPNSSQCTHRNLASHRKTKWQVTNDQFSSLALDNAGAQSVIKTIPLRYCTACSKPMNWPLNDDTLPLPISAKPQPSAGTSTLNLNNGMHQSLIHPQHP